MVHRMAADPLVGALLALHDLHPVPLRQRVEHAMTVAARKLGSHGGDVRLLGIDDDGTVRVEVPTPVADRRPCGRWWSRRSRRRRRTRPGSEFVERAPDRRSCRSGCAGRAMTGLRRFLVDDPAAAEVQERCELCATPIPPSTRTWCRWPSGGCCAPAGPAGSCSTTRAPAVAATPGCRTGTWSTRRSRLTEDRWDALQIPVGMAFFLHNSVRGAIVACYPSPAGATESELSLDAWGDGIGAGPLAAQLLPDVEALLVRREPAECLLVPIDACYRLVGLVRLHWRGFDGGAEAWSAINTFFADLHSRAQRVPTGTEGGGTGGG